MAERGEGSRGGTRVAVPRSRRGRAVVALGAGLLRHAAVRAGLLCSTALLPASGAHAQLAPNARPTGGAVVAGSAGIAQGAGQTTVTQSSQRAAVEWQQFNVGANHTVQFVQPNAQAATLNRVVGPDPSVIAGRIRANTPDGGVGGMVAIVNQSGVVFANGSQVNVGSLIASAANVTNQNFMAGRMVFDGAARPGARVENHGTITVADRGLAALVGPRVANSGLIQGRLARVALQGGAEAYSLDLAGDGMLSIDVTQAVRGSTNGVALATNSGVIEAPGGSVLISAHAASGLVEDLVRNTGRISANTADGRAGRVALRANGGNVRIDGTVEARGAAPGSSGGRIQAEAVGGAVTVAAGARVSASGDAAGGAVQIGGRTTREARVEGRVTARGRSGRGGQVAVQATEAVSLGAAAGIDVSGGAGGGTALIGTEGLGRAQVMAARTSIAAGATVRADATLSGPGGTIVVNSTTMTEVRGTLSARGGATGGDGGFVEVSTLGGIVFPDMLAQVDVTAPAGRAGTLLLDPDTIRIGAGGSAVGGNVGAADTPATLNLTAASVGSFAGNLVLEALHRIEVNDQVNRTGGALTLSVTGASAVGDGIVVAASGGIAVTGGNRFLTLTSANAGTSAGTVTVAGALSTAGANADLTIRAGSVTTSGAGTLSAGRNLEVTTNGAAGIALGAAASASPTGRVALTGDAIGITAGTVSAGTVTLAAAGANTAVSLGGAAAPGVLAIGSATLGAITAPVLAVRATGTGGVSVDAAVNRGAGTLDLQGATVGQAAGAPITAAALRAVATVGDVALVTAPGTPNAIGTVAGRGETGFALTNGQALSIGTVGASTGIAASGASTVRLVIASGDLTQTAPITGGARLLASAQAGDVVLDHAGNAAVRVAGAATSSFTLVNSQALEYGTVGGTAGVTLGAGGTLDLRTTSGDLTQTVAVAAATLRAQADAGSVLLASSINSVGTVAGSAAGTFGLLNSPALTVGVVRGTAGITAGTGGVSLTSDIAITTLAGAPITSGSGTTVALRADSMTIGDRIAAPGGTISLSTNTVGTGAVLGGNGAGAGLVIDSAELGLLGGSGADGTAVPATRLLVTASLGIDLAGDVALRGRIGTLQLDSTGGITQSAGRLDVPRLVARAATGVAVSDPVAGNAIDEVAVALTTAAGIAVRSSGATPLTVVTDTDSGIAGIGGPVTPATVSLAGTALALAAPVTGGAVTLAASGAITQDATGPVTAATLTVQGLTGAGSAAGSVRLDQPGNAIASFGPARATGDVVLRADGASVALGGTVRSDAGNVTLGNGQAGGTLALTGGQVQAPLGTATINADAFDFGAPGIRVSGQGVAIGPTSAIDVLVGGAATPGALVLDGTVFARLAATTRLTLGGGGTRDVVFRTGGDFTLLAPELGVIAGRSVSQDVGGLVAGRLQVAAGRSDAAGGITLDAAGNTVARFGAETGATGNLLFRAGGFEVTGITAGGTIGLTATSGSITQSGTIGGGVLTARADAAGASVLLDSLANAVAGATGSAAQVFAVRNGAALSVGTTAGTTVRLRADTGDVTQTAAISAGTLLATADAGAVRLADLANAVATVGGSAGTSFAYRDADGLSVSGITAGTNVRLQADTGSIAQTGAIAAASVTAEATGGAVDLGTVANGATAIGGTASSGFAYRGATGFDVTGIAGGTLVRLTADAGGITQSGAITGSSLLAAATGGGVALGTLANGPGTVGGSATGDFAYRGGAGLAVSGISAGGAVRLTADTGDITQTGTIGGTALTATATTGAVTLGTLANAAGSVGGTAAGSFGFRNAAGFDVTGIAAGTTVALRADAGGITQSGVVSGTLLTATATGGAVALGTQANALAGVGGTAGGSFGFRNAAGFDVTGIAAGTTVALTADTGGITQSGTIGGTALTATAAGGSVALGGLANAVGSVGGTAGTSFGFRNGGGFDVAGIAAGTTVALTANAGGITQSGIIGGTTLSATATGGGIALDTQANTLGGFGALAGGSVGFRNATGFDVTGIAAGTTVALRADAGGITQSGAISGTLLTATTPGGSVALDTQANALGGFAATAGGSVGFRNAAGLAVTGIAAGTTVALTADAGSITQSGTISGTVLTATASGGAVALDTQANALGGFGGTAGGSVAFRNAGGFDVAGIAAGTTVALTADSGGITQSGAISGTLLTATTPGGSVALGSRANGVAGIGGSAGGDFAWRSAAGFDVTGIAAGTTVSLTADTGGITQSGAISGALLTATTPGGSVALGTIANGVAGIGGSAGGGFAWRGAGGFDVTGITAGTTVALRADTGGITQSGAISGATLTATAPGGSVALGTQANALGGVGGSAGGGFAWRDADGFDVTGITAGTTVSLRADTGGITQSGAIGAAALTATTPGGSVDLLTLANAVASIGGSSGTAFAYRGAAGFDVAGIAAGTTVTLRADTGSITQSGAISGSVLAATAPGGAVTLENPANALSGVGGSVGGSFRYRDATGFDVTGITAGTTVTLAADTGSISQSGAISATALGVSAPGGAIALDSLANAVPGFGATAGGSIAFRNSAGIVVSGITAGTTVALTADTGSISQTGSIAGTALTATAPGGAVVLGGLANALGQAGGSAGTGFAFRNAAGFDVTGITAGSTVALVADTGGITQSGAISGATLTATAAGGSVALGSQANTLGSVGGSAAGSFAWRDADGVDIAGITAGTTVSLTADTGGITQSGPIAGTLLSLSAPGGSVNLGTLANGVAGLGGSAGGSIGFRNAAGFDVTGLAAGTTIALTADTGSITQSGAISGTALTATALGGSVALGTQANALASVGGTAGGSFAWRDADGFDVNGITAGTTVSLTADSGNITQSGAISGTALAATTPGGSVALGTQANTLGSVGGTAGGSFAWRDADGFDVTGITAGTTVSLTADSGSITQSGAISGTALTATAAGGSVALGSQDNALAQVGGTAGGSFAWRDADGFEVTGITAGTTVSLTAATGSITQSGAIGAGLLAATAPGGSVILDTRANAVAQVGGTAGGGFGWRGAGGFAVTGITAGTTVSLTADAGSITQTGAIAAAALLANAPGGSVALGTQANALAAVGGTAGTSFTYRDATGFDVTGIIAGTAVLLTAETGGITQSGAIQAASLGVTAPGGSVALGTSANRLASVGGSAGGSFTWRDADGVDITGITAGAGVTLGSDAGSITQSGAITGTTLQATTPGGMVALDSLANSLGSVGGAAGGGFGFRNAGGFDVAGITAATTVALRADAGGITQSGAIAAATLLATAPGGPVALDTQANTVARIGGSSGGSFAWRGADGFEVTGITAGTTVALTADTGSMTQSGIIAGTALVATAPGGSVVLDSQANALGRVGGSAGSGFAWRDADGFEVTGITAGTMVALTADAGSITQSGAIAAATLVATAPGGSVVLDSLANMLGRVGGSAGSGFAWRDADGFEVTGITAGTTVSLTADAGSITQSGAIAAATLVATAPGGSVVLDSQANALGRVGGSAGGGFAWRDADGFEVTGITAGTGIALTAATGDITQSGILQAPALTAQAPGGAVSLDTLANLLDRAGGVAGTRFGLRDANGLEVTGITAGTVAALTVDAGGITQSGAIQAPVLTVAAPGGAVDLATVANRVGGMGGSAAGSIAFRDADGFEVTGITAGTGVSLLSDAGGITQSGIITGGPLDARAPGGDVTLLGDNHLISVGGRAGGRFDFRNIGSFNVDGITAGTVVGLTSVSGGITQTGAIRAAALEISAAAPGQSILLDGAPNEIVQLEAATDETFTFLSAGPLLVAGIRTGTNGSVGLRAQTGNITQTGAIRTGSLQARADAGSVDLVASDNRVTTLAGTATTGFALRNGQSLTIGTVLGTAGLAAPLVDLRLTAGSLTQSAAIVTPGLRARADAGSILLTGANRVGVVAGSAAGDIRLANAQTLTVGAVAGTAGLTSTGGGATTIALATTAGDLLIQGGNITALGANALVSLTSAAGIAQGSGIIATRRLSLQAGNGVTLGNPNQFETLVGAQFGPAGLVRGQAYTVTGAVDGTGSFALLAAGGLAIGGPGLGPSVTSTGGGITLASDAGPVSIGPSAIRAFGGPISVTGPAGVTLAGTSLLAAGPIILAAPAGPMSLSGVAATTNGAFSATAAGPVTLSGVSLFAQGPLGIGSRGSLAVSGSTLSSASVDPLDGVTLAALGSASVTGTQISAANRVTVQAAGALGMDGTAIAADTAVLAGQVVTLGNVTATIGRDLLVAGPGGIVNAAPLVVVPRVAGQFPAVIYDTRTAPPQPVNAILAYVQPDQPGLQPDQQPTQLRSSPGAETADPFFGASSGAPAGAVSMNLQAGASPVFLLLDGGTALGTLTAGRLRVHGTGGRVELQGTLGGLTGAEASRASDITRPVTPESLPDYRINSCVIGSINCIVAPRFQPIPPSVRTTVDFTFRQNAFNPADVIIPNTGENDYE